MTTSVLSVLNYGQGILRSSRLSGGRKKKEEKTPRRLDLFYLLTYLPTYLRTHIWTEMAFATLCQKSVTNATEMTQSINILGSFNHGHQMSILPSVNKSISIGR